MRRYETIVILKPSLGDAENQAIIDRAVATIEQFDGSIVKIDNWGLRKTAYPIDKETQGYYVYLQYAGLPAGVFEMERVFRIDEKVMKYLTVKLQDVFAALPEDEAVEETESAAESAPETVEVKTEEEVKTEVKDEEKAGTSETAVD
ncbi:MAG: 30S ribosomal protein S6 [Desulfurivibrionaceae bacterium]|nr:30S ribosomal protein S6 [Desulfurivibrionaceae bacterium]